MIGVKIAGLVPVWGFSSGIIALKTAISSLTFQHLLPVTLILGVNLIERIFTSISRFLLLNNEIP